MNKCKVIFLILLTFSLSFLIGCNKNNFIYQEAMPFSEDVAAIKVDGLYGFVDKSGKSIISPNYDSVTQFFNNHSIVSKNNKYGVIDKDNNLTIPCQYDSIDFIEKSNFYIALINNSYKCISNENKVIFDFSNYIINNFYKYGSDHLIITFSKDNKQGFVDVISGMAIEPSYDSLSVYVNTDENAPMISYQNNDSWGYIDVNSKFISEPIYEEEVHFSNNLAPVRVDSKYGFIDLSGNLVIPPSYEEVGSFCNDLAYVRINNKYGCINKSGELIIDPIFGSELNFILGNFTLTYLNGEKVVVNNKGQLLDIPPILSISSFDKDLITATTLNDDCTTSNLILNADGNVLAVTSYESIGNFSNGEAPTSLLGKCGYINKKGIEIIPPLYDDIIRYNNIFIVKNNSKFGIVNEINNNLLSIEYDDITPINKTILALKKDGKYDLFNLETRNIIHTQLDEINFKAINSKINFDLTAQESIPFSPIPVKKSGQWFYIDEKGDKLF